MGDVDYMRTVKKIRRTYAKTPTRIVPDLETEVSAMTAKKQKAMDATQSSLSASQPRSSSSTPTPSEVRERRRADSSMDMFRNMAKDIRKS
jgi:hypothetical protein